MLDCDLIWGEGDFRSVNMVALGMSTFFKALVFLSLFHWAKLDIFLYYM